MSQEQLLPKPRIPTGVHRVVEPTGTTSGLMIRSIFKVFGRPPSTWRHKLCPPQITDMNQTVLILRHTRK